MLTARVGRVEIRLDDQSQAAADDAVAVLAPQRSLHARHAFVRYTLHQADIEANLVPLDDGAFNLEEWEADARLCAQTDRRGKRAFVGALGSSGCHSRQFWGDLRIKLFRVSRILVLVPAYASGKW